MHARVDRAMKITSLEFRKKTLVAASVSQSKTIQRNKSLIHITIIHRTLT